MDGTNALSIEEKELRKCTFRPEINKINFGISGIKLGKSVDIFNKLFKEAKLIE